MVHKTNIFALVGGGMLIYRYLNSVSRLTKVVDVYKKQISQTTDPVKKRKLTEKLNKYQLKLQQANSEGRVKKAEFIEKTKQITTNLNTLKQNKGDPEKIKKLQTELQNRTKISSKLNLIK